jgi:glycosyltransferase involved in cell wall biosynthesis
MSSISVITICYNNLHGLINTCNSVDMQIIKPHEHIIIDGSSTREIKNYLEQNTQPSYRKWISEPDNGISDAFNKGIKKSTGDIVVMLNSGDVFFDAQAIELVTQQFEQNSFIQWLHGKYKIRRGNHWVIIGKPFEKKKLYRGMRSVCHQSMFVKKSLHSKYGLYDTAEKTGMDYDFLCRIADEQFAFLPVPLVIFEPLGISSSGYLLSLKNAKNIYQKYFGKSILLDIWQMRLRFLYHLLNSRAGRFLYKIKIKFKLENM